MTSVPITQIEKSNKDSIFSNNVVNNSKARALLLSGFFTTVAGSITYALQNESHTGYNGYIVKLHDNVLSPKKMFKDIELPPRRIKPANKAWLAISAIGLALGTIGFFVEKSSCNKAGLT